MKFENHYFSEVDPYCVELYQKRFPDAIALGDIKEIDCDKIMVDAGRGGGIQPEKSGWQAGRRIGDTSQEWILTGGFPCTDISVAGKGEGIRGSRSGLWFEYWRLIRELRPRFAIMENVGALTFRGLTDVLGSLAEIGYDAEWQDIRAEDVGAPHRRERIWIVAYPASGNAGSGTGEQQSQKSTHREPALVLSDPGGGSGAAKARDNNAEMADTSRELLDGAGKPGQGGRRESTDGGERAVSMRMRSDINDTDGRTVPGLRENIVRSDESVRNEDGGGWATEPSVGRLAHGVSDKLE